MPDTFTTNRDHLRDALQGLGAKCGREARVLKPRDPEWTCHADSVSWQGDVYIHSVSDFYKHTAFVNPLIILFILGIFLGLGWGKRFWKN